MLQMGIRAGEWQIQPLPRLRYFMRPEHPPKVRIAACGQIMAGNSTSRLATVKDAKTGKMRPAVPADIQTELNRADPIGRITRQTVRSENGAKRT